MALGKLKKLFKDEEETELTNGEEEFYSVTEEEALKEANKDGNKMILLEPRSFSEAQAIADHLKHRNSVVVNLKRVTSDQAKRIIYFLSGTLYAIGGDMQKLGNGIYLCTPKNVTVDGRMSDAEEDKKAKAKIEDDLDF